LTGYAYETIPNKAIRTGQTQEVEKGIGQGEPAVLKQPARKAATLGELAKGVKGLHLRRQGQDQSLVSNGK